MCHCVLYICIDIDDNLQNLWFKHMDCLTTDSNIMDWTYGLSHYLWTTDSTNLDV